MQGSMVTDELNTENLMQRNSFLKPFIQFGSRALELPKLAFELVFLAKLKVLDNMKGR